MSMLARCALVAIAIALIPAIARSGDLDSLVAANTYEIQLSEGRLSGPGAAWLATEADAAQYFMLGEQHATADIAQMATALFRMLHDRGYGYAAVEVGPFSTRAVERLLRSGPGAFEKYVAVDGRQLTFPFFFFEEELDFGRTVVGLAGDAPGALWGLDQEFIAAGGLLLERLEARADTPETEAAVAAAKATAKEDPMFLGSGPDGPWRKLRDAFEAAGDREALELLGAIELSRRVYAPFVGRGGSVYLANLEREDYMKTNFAADLAAVEKRTGRAPRVFLKFGANHVAYGHSPTHVLSLGTFVRELGVSRGARTFNVHCDCIGGETRDPRSGGTVPCESYFLGEDGALRSYLRDDAITLIDLRALRPHARLWKDLDEKSRDLILAYDAYLAMPNVRPATVVAP